MKSFYPHQNENIFTNNNWTLSDELIEIFQSNIFYKEHVRYNVQRFRPSDVPNELCEENQSQTSTKTASDLNEIVSNDTDIAYTCPLSVTGKRKLESRTNSQDYSKRVQPRRIKKH